MATVFIQFDHACASQGHVTLNVSLNGVPKAQIAMHVDQLDAVVRDEEIEIFVRLALRAHKIGKTLGQVRTNLLNGITVTL